MTQYYVKASRADDTGDGLTWATAKKTANAAAAAAVAAGGGGHIINVSANAGADVSVGASYTVTGPAALANAFILRSVRDNDNGGSEPPVAADIITGAAIKTEGGTVGLALQGFWSMVEGMTLAAADPWTSGGTNHASVLFGSGSGAVLNTKNCVIKSGAATTSTFISPINAAGTRRYRHQGTEFNSPSATFGGFNLGGAGAAIEFQNCTFTGTWPASLFGNNSAGYVDFFGCDLSTALNGKSLVSNTTNGSLRIEMRNCKLPANWYTFSGNDAVPTNHVVRMEYIDCDDGTAVPKFGATDAFGKQTVETTVVRTGGGQDHLGNNVAVKVVTNSFVGSAMRLQTPFRTLRAERYLAAGTYNIRIHGTWGGASRPTKQDCWIFANRTAQAGDRRYDFITGGPTNSADGDTTQHSSSASTWGGGTTPFAMDLPVTMTKEGLLSFGVAVAKASDTFYFDILGVEIT